MLKRSTLKDFAERHPRCEPSLSHWRRIVEAAAWTSVGDVQRSFAKANALNGDRVRFELGDGHRLVCASNFPAGIAYIKLSGHMQSATASTPTPSISSEEA